MLHLTVLAASGATGRELTRQALERGHTVTGIARDPGRIPLPDSDRLIRVAADVRDHDSITRALEGSTIVLSGLGVADGDQPGILTTGARVVVDAHPDRILWMGAFGTGASAQAAGAVTRTLLRAFMRAELGDKVAADSTVLDAGGTVFHAGPLTSGPLSPTRRTVGLEAAPRRLFPSRVSRATVSAAMLDQAEAPSPPRASSFLSRADDLRAAVRAGAERRFHPAWSALWSSRHRQHPQARRRQSRAAARRRFCAEVPTARRDR